MSGRSHSLLWSKRKGLEVPYPLLPHLLDTGASCLVLWDRWLRPGLRDLIAADFGGDHVKARSAVAAIAALHDIGKASPVFQGQLTKPGTEEDRLLSGFRDAATAAGYDFCVDPMAARQGFMRRHEQVSALHLSGAELDHNTPVLDGQWGALAALGHHGSFRLDVTDELDIDTFSDFACGVWEGARDDLEQVVLEAFGAAPADFDGRVSSAVAVLICGLVVLADQTASEGHSVTAGQRLLDRAPDIVDDGRRWVDVRVRYYSRRIGKTLGTYQGFDDPVKQILGDKTPTQLQSEAQGVGDGLWVVTAPTGTGKTEAALLRHSTRDERLIFALPTQATTTSMMERVLGYYAGVRNTGTLAHSTALVTDVYASMVDSSGKGLAPTEFVRSGMYRMLASVSVSTIDQVLAGALRSKWAHLRLLTLANAHVVLDEVHLADHYQTALLAPLLRWLGATRTRVTLLTATLPTWQREELSAAYEPAWRGAGRGSVFPAHENITASSTPVPVEDAPARRIACSLPYAEDPVERHLEWVSTMRTAAPRSRLGVIVNTVGRAQLAATRLQASGERVIVLHSRMTAAHRSEVTDLLNATLGRQKDGEGLVVVGTQAVEASLDIDLDAMSSDLAPAPSLIQRVGRVWRHEDPRRAGRLPGARDIPFQVVRGVGQGAHLPYFTGELSRTWAHLRGLPGGLLDMPSGSQAFVESAAFTTYDAKTSQEHAEAVERITKAGNVAIEPHDFLRDDADLSSFGRLTELDLQDEEAVTRLIRMPVATAVVVGNAPGAWDGTVDELESIEPGDRESLKEAMGATVPLNGKLARAALALRPDGWEPKSAMLAHTVPVVLGVSGLTYDDLIGLTWDEM